MCHSLFMSCWSRGRMGLRLRSDLASIIDCRLVEGQCPRLGTGTTLAETLGPRPNDIALGLTL